MGTKYCCPPSLKSPGNSHSKRFTKQRRINLDFHKVLQLIPLNPLHQQTWRYTKGDEVDRKEGDWCSSDWEEGTRRSVYQQCQQMELGKAGQVISRMLGFDIIDSARA